MEINTMENKDNFDSHLDSHHDKIFGLHELKIRSLARFWLTRVGLCKICFGNATMMSLNLRRV